MLLRHGFQYLLARGVPGVLNFLAIAIYTRLLSPEQYGAYTLTIATVSAVDALLLHWLRLALLRFLPRANKDASGTLPTILRIYLLISLGVSVVAVAVGWLIIDDPLTRQLIVLGAGLFVVQATFELTVERERSELSPRRYGLYSGIKSVVALGVGAGLAAAGLGAVGLLIGLTAALILPLITLGGLTRWAGALRGYDPILARQIAIYGLPLAATSALAFLISSSDRFMLAGMIDTAAAGQYAVGYDLAQFTLGLLLNIVNLAAYPLIVAAFENDGVAATRTMLRWTLRLMLLIGLPATIGLAVLAPNVAHVLIGSDFESAAVMIIPGIAAAALLFGLKAFYFDLAFQLSGNTIKQVWVLIVTALLNIGLNLWLIPAVGILGAVYSTVAAQIIAILLSWWLGRGSLQVPLPDATTLPIVFATGVMLAVLLLTRGWTGPLQLLGQVAIGVAVFFAALLLVDRKFLRKVTSPRG